MDNVTDLRYPDIYDYLINFHLSYCRFSENLQLPGGEHIDTIWLCDEYSALESTKNSTVVAGRVSDSVRDMQ